MPAPVPSPRPRARRFADLRVGIKILVAPGGPGCRRRVRRRRRPLPAEPPAGQHGPAAQRQRRADGRPGRRQPGPAGCPGPGGRVPGRRAGRPRQAPRADGRRARRHGGVAHRVLLRRRRQGGRRRAGHGRGRDVHRDRPAGLRHGRARRRPRGGCPLLRRVPPGHDRGCRRRRDVRRGRGRPRAADLRRGRPRAPARPARSAPSSTRSTTTRPPSPQRSRSRPDHQRDVAVGGRSRPGSTEIAANILGDAAAAQSTTVGVGDAQRSAVELARLASELQSSVAAFRV